VGLVDLGLAAALRAFRFGEERPNAGRRRWKSNGAKIEPPPVERVMDRYRAAVGRR
jgi:hypothetical protein